jgi:hypothetical protein
MLRRIVRDPRYLPYVLSVVAALLIVPEMPSPVCRPTWGWRGWYVLLYREDAAPALEAALPEAVAGSASRATATVRINAFSEIEELPVSALKDRLDPLDPRMDTWLSGAGGYFTAGNGGPWSVVAYVPATLGRISAGIRLARAFRAGAVPPGSWRLLELEPLAMISGPVAAIGFVLVIAWFLRRQSRGGLLLASAGWLVCLPGLLNGGLPDLLFSCTLLYFWMARAAEEVHAQGRASFLHSGRTGVRIGVLLIVAGLIVLADGAVVYRATRMGASVLCLELLSGLAGTLQQLRRPRQRVRSRFEPVPILAPWRPAFAPLAAILAAGLLVTVPVGLSRLSVPLPRLVSLARAGSRPGIEAAARAGDAGHLPGLADAVSHLASLQTAAFGAATDGDVGTGGTSTLLPPREGQVLLREYAPGAADGLLVEAPRTMVRFDPAWLDRIATGFRTGTVERLLVDQDRTVTTRLRMPLTTLLRSVPAALACLVLFGAPLAGPAARRLLMRLGLWAITEPARRRRTR